MSASGACVVVPGESVADGQTYGDGDMRAIAAPTVYVGDGQIGTDQMDPDLLGTLGGGPNLNYFLNPNFGDPFWQLGTGPVSCPVGAPTVLASDWWVNPTGAAVTQQQSTSVPNVNSLFSLLITGAAGATTVLAGQNLPRDVSAFLQQNFTVSFWLYNDTGAAITPSVTFATPSVEDNFTTVGTQNTTAGSSCPPNAWTRVSVTVDGSSWGNITNGLQVAVKIPSGALAAGTQSVNLSQLKLELGAAATAFVPPYDMATVNPETNLFVNGNLDETLWGVSSGSCQAGADTMLVDRWFCNPAVTACTLSRGTAVPNDASMSNATIVGGSTTDVVDFGQNFERALAGQLQQSMTFSGWVYNGTGSSFTPSLMIWTPAGANQFGGTLNLQNQVAMAACPNGAWTLVQATFTGTVTGVTNGLRIALRLPSGAVGGGKTASLAQLQLVLGSVATPFQVSRTSPPAAVVIGATRGLVITNDGGSPQTVVDITCTEAVLKNAGGFAMLGSGISASVNSGTVGANGLDTGALALSTHYAIWLIGTMPGQAVAGLLSLSFTAPALPAGYQYACLVGACRTDGSTHFLYFRTCGRRTWMRPVSVLSTAPGGTNGAYQALSLAAVVPGIAFSVSGNYGMPSSTANLLTRVAGDENGLGEMALLIPNTGVSQTMSAPAGDVNYVAAPFGPVPVSGQTMYIAPGDASKIQNVDITGWEF